MTPNWAGMRIVGSGWYVPPGRVDNETVASWCDTTAEWIVERTGVRERRFAEPHQATSAMAVRALEAALAAAGLDPEDLQGVIVATSTPDQPQPPTAVFVLAALGLSGIPAVDVNGVCVSFMYGLSMVAGWATNGPCAVIGADKYSTILNRRDRRTASLFGDGAGAVIFDARPLGGGSGDLPGAEPRVLSFAARCEPVHRDLVRIRAGGSAMPTNPNGDPLADRFEMDGRGVMTWAQKALPVAVTQACDRAGVSVFDIDRFVLHQGNVRMVEQCADWLGVPAPKVAISADRYGNTGAASIPLTLALELRENRIRPGDLVVLAGLGGGTAACASVVQW